MDVGDRKLEILQLLEGSGKVAISKLSSDFSVSEMTVRRDLETLESEGLLKRIRGGAVSATSRSYEPPFQLRIGRAREEKERIAQLAASQISDKETVILDVGTTTLALAEELKHRQGLTVITPSLRVAWTLADKPGFTVIVTGGIVRCGERSLVGALSERAFESLYCDVFFMGVGGIDVQAGFTDFSLEDARTKQEAIKHSKRCIALADSSKLGKVAFSKIAGLQEVDALMTSNSADTKETTKLENAGLEVIRG